MNEIGNYITFYTKNITQEILNLINSSNQQIVGEVLKVIGDNLIININSQTIVAKNHSSFLFKEGDKVYLTGPKYEGGKLTFKVANFLSGDKQTASYIDLNDSLRAISSLKFQDLNTGINVSDIVENLNKLSEAEDFIYIEKEKIPGSFLEFAKKNEVFLGTVTTQKEAELDRIVVKVGEECFEIENNLNMYIQEKIKENESFSDSNNKLFLFIFDNKKGLILIPKETVANEEFKKILLSIFSDGQVSLKEEKDFLVVLSLVLAKKQITKEEFFKEKLQLNRFLVKINELFASRNKNGNLERGNLAADIKESFFLFKLIDSQDKDFSQKVVQILSDLRFDQKESVRFDFGNFYLNIFNFSLNVDNNSFKLQLFVNKKKNSSTKASSIMIRINTQTMGCVGIYVKKVSQNNFKAIIASDRLCTLKLIRSKENELITALKDRGYNLNIDYKMEDTSTANVILDFLTFETSIQKIDMKV